jgi:endonuclease/exonuclease/phosphatase family metal-dependent hydrolase
MSGRPGAARALALIAALAALAAGVLARPAAARAEPAALTVMTRNVYLGSDLTRVATAGGVSGLFDAVAAVWANVAATDLPTRADAIAAEIAQHRPDLVGLQEVVLWRDQTPATMDGAPDAGRVVHDALALIQGALAARGLRYSAVAVSTNADIELPRFDPASPNGFTDVRLTDRDVILRNEDAPGLATANAGAGRYAAQVVLRPPVGPRVSFARGFAHVDATLAGRVFRFVATHLEVGAAGPLQEAQAAEVLAGPLGAALPTILVCDCNSAADGSTTASYGMLAGAGFADAWSAAPAGDGATCCQSELLDRPGSRLGQRIDLVLFRGAGMRAAGATRTGAAPFRLTAAPYWASDHAGVVARLLLD